MMPSHTDLERQFEQLMERKPLPEAEMKSMCDQARAILVEEWNVQPVKCPVTVCSDIHGDEGDDCGEFGCSDDMERHGGADLLAPTVEEEIRDGEEEDEEDVVGEVERKQGWL